MLFLKQNSMKTLVEELKKKKLTIGSCESLTAGLFSSKLASVSGASSVFKGGIVTYWNECKMKVVHVSSKTIETFGVVSNEVAYEMAVKAREILDVDICVSFTGNAGPDALEGKEVGQVHCAIATKDHVQVFEFHFQGTRNEIREAVCYQMRDCLLKQLGNEGESNGR